MPRPLLFNTQSTQQETTRLDATHHEENRDLRTDPLACERAFRKRRSQKYMDAMVKLDAGTGHISQEDIDQMLQAIRDEFPDIEVLTDYLGSMAICHLGDPFESHILVPESQCIIHYSRNYTFESPLDKCRNLCLMPDYLFVEIYDNTFRAIGKNGSVAKLPAPGAGDAWKRLLKQPTTAYHGPHEGFL